MKSRNIDNIYQQLKGDFWKERKKTVYMEALLPISEMNCVKSANIPEYDLSPFIDELHLSSKTQERAKSILVEAERAGFTARKAPESLIAAALYIACILEKERRTQEAIGQVTGVSTNTIQTRYKQLIKELQIKSYSQ